MTDLRNLVAEFPLAGRLDAIVLRPARGEPVLRPLRCRALERLGLEEAIHYVTFGTNI